FRDARSMVLSNMEGGRRAALVWPIVHAATLMAISRTPTVPGLPALYLTMLACTIASIAVAHRDSSSEEVRELRWLGLCVLGIGVGLTCATAVWLALGRKWLVFRALAALIACGISAWSIEQVFSQPTF